MTNLNYIANRSLRFARDYRVFENLQDVRCYWCDRMHWFCTSCVLCKAFNGTGLSCRELCTKYPKKVVELLQLKIILDEDEMDGCCND